VCVYVMSFTPTCRTRRAPRACACARACVCVRVHVRVRVCYVLYAYMPH
jgi:hypothetical protein